MGLSVCPAAIVAAPVELVWANLVQWERYPDWAGVRAEQIEPPGPAAAGQSITFAGQVLGRTLRFIFKVEALDPARHTLDLHVFFPFGLQEKPHIVCTPVDAANCRVQYGWDFIFPPGWRGWVLEKFSSKAIAGSVNDSLRQLKRASERQYRPAQAAEK